VQHRRRDGVSAEGEPAHGIEVEVFGQLVHDQAHQGRGLAIQGDPSQVDVVVGFAPRGQGDLATHDGLGLDQLEQAGTRREYRGVAGVAHR